MSSAEIINFIYNVVFLSPSKKRKKISHDFVLQILSFVYQTIYFIMKKLPISRNLQKIVLWLHITKNTLKCILKYEMLISFVIYELFYFLSPTHISYKYNITQGYKIMTTLGLINWGFIWNYLYLSAFQYL